MLHYQMNQTGFQTDTAFGDIHMSKQLEHGHRPYELFVSGIASCSGFALQVVLEKMRISFADIHIKTVIERNPEVANRIEKIVLFFTISGSDASEKQLTRALELTRKHCGMIQSVKDSIYVSTTIQQADPIPVAERT